MDNPPFKIKEIGAFPAFARQMFEKTKKRGFMDYAFFFFFFILATGNDIELVIWISLGPPTFFFFCKTQWFQMVKVFKSCVSKISTLCFTDCN